MADEQLSSMESATNQVGYVDQNSKPSGVETRA